MTRATRRTSPRRPSREPAALCRALIALAELPARDQLGIAARYRLATLLHECGDDTTKLAARLGVHVRSAQRLRVLFGNARTPNARTVPSKRGSR